MLRIAIALVLVAHGIGHSLGLLQVFKVATVNPAWNGDSWILSDALGATATHAIGVAVWSLAIVGFAMLAAVLMGWLPEGLWAPLAIGSALMSLAGLLLFPIAFPTGSTIAALVVDLAVLVAILWYHLEPGDLSA